MQMLPKREYCVVGHKWLISHSGDNSAFTKQSRREIKARMRRYKCPKKLIKVK